MEVGDVSWFVCLGHANYDSPVTKTDVLRVLNPAVLPYQEGTSVGGVLLVRNKPVVPTYLLPASPL